MLLLKQNIIKEKRISKLFSEYISKFEVSNNKKYKVKTIKDNIIYTKKPKR